MKWLLGLFLAVSWSTAFAGLPDGISEVSLYNAVEPGEPSHFEVLSIRSAVSPKGQKVYVVQRDMGKFSVANPIDPTRARVLSDSEVEPLAVALNASTFGFDSKGLFTLDPNKAICDAFSAQTQKHYPVLSVKPVGPKGSMNFGCRAGLQPAMRAFLSSANAAADDVKRGLLKDQ